MIDWRTLGFGAVAFSATFAIGWWLGLGKAISLPAAIALPSAFPWSSAPPPDRPIVARPSPASEAPAGRPTARPGLTDEGVRQDVILRANAYQRPTCNQDPKSLYVTAATRYAEALMRSAGCHGFPKCRVGWGQLNDVWLLNRSAPDLRVAEAMAAAHAAGGLSEKDFRGDVGVAVRVIAGGGFSSGPAPECQSSGTRGRTWRVRIRR
jgi:hypothetical protein